MILNKAVVTSKDSEIHQLARQVSEEIFAADNLSEAIDINNRNNDIELVIFDDTYGPEQIIEFKNRTNKPQLSPIIVIGNCQENLSTNYGQAGVCDYINKDDHAQLQDIIKKLKNSPSVNNAVAVKNNFFAEDWVASSHIVGQSNAVLETLKMIKLIASSNCNPILIVGETGTGKELAAKAVHNIRHSKEPFVAINCAALTANLLESELFGHVKGSFTGADREKTGLLELAGTGTLFLDEISEMPLDLQAKLLRVLQEKNFRKVGGTVITECNATIIASSNRNLLKEVQVKKFRSDLYYRLNICPIYLHPLRAPERRDDIKLLADYFLKTSNICPEKCKKITSLTKMAMEALEKHSWPGNVRELRNVMERAILLETTDKIGLSSIKIDSIEESLSNGPTNTVLHFSLEKAEKELIAKALKETGWQKTQTAALLGITRATLYAKLKQYNLDKTANDASLESEVAEESSYYTTAAS